MSFGSGIADEAEYLVKIFIMRHEVKIIIDGMFSPRLRFREWPVLSLPELQLSVKCAFTGTQCINLPTC